MTAAYNEIDPFAAAWLRELIKAGHIAPGEVLECSIEDLTPNDLKPFHQVHLFAGIGVWSYALRRIGWPDDRRIWTASCPCQPFSAAGKSGGFDDERHLWPSVHYLASVCRPPVIVGEQVASKDGLGWLDLVQADMDGTGYAFGAVDTCAAGFGAPHIRQRLYWVANTISSERPDREPGKRVEHDEGGRVQSAAAPTGLCDDLRPGPTNGHWRAADWLFCRDGKWRAVEPGTFPLAHGASARVGRLRGYGNAIVAPQAEAFLRAALLDDHVI